MFLTPDKLAQQWVEKNRVHLIGGAGIGMQGIHNILQYKGFRVTISDSDFVGGIPESEFPNEAEVIVVSSAIREDHPQYLWATINNIPVVHRSECLKNLIPVDSEVISISGAHGKTTSSALIAHILNSSFAIGGVMVGSEKVASLEKDSKYFVVEADESDGSMLNLCGNYAMLTNLDNEHLEYYGSFSKYLKSMNDFINKSNICFIYTSCNQFINAGKNNLIWYGPGSDKTGELLGFRKDENGIALMDVMLKGPWGKWKISTSLIGNHMIENILGAVTLLYHLEIPEEIIKSKISSFKGVRKRGEIKLKNNRIFINDYAHHPNEISTTIAAYKQAYKPELIHVIWEPHRFSRLRDNGLESFAKALSHADRILVLPVWSANEEEIPGFSPNQIASAVSGQLIEIEYLEKYIQDETQSGDLIIAVGAGGIYKNFKRILEDLQN